jgi:hypothetical protein
MVIGNRVKTGPRDDKGILFSDKSIFPDDMGIFPDDKFILADDMGIFLDDKSTFPDDMGIFLDDKFIFPDDMGIFLDDKSILHDDLGVSDKPVTLTFLQPWVSTLVKISHPRILSLSQMEGERKPPLTNSRSSPSPFPKGRAGVGILDLRDFLFIRFSPFPK